MALAWAWQQIFMKKSIALAVSVIVSKYAILGIFIYLLIANHLIDALGFLVGAGVILPVVIHTSVAHKNELSKLEMRIQSGSL